MGRRPKPTPDHFRDPLKVDPDTATSPVATSYSRLAPPIPRRIHLSPFPIVIVNLEFDVRRVCVPFFHLPAVTVFIAKL